MNNFESISQSVELQRPRVSARAWQHIIL